MVDNLNGVNYDWEDSYQRWYGLVRKVKDGLEAGMVGVLLNFVLVLVYCVCFDMMKERSIMWIDPRILRKIYEQRWFDNRYVGKRFYTDNVKKQYNLNEDHYAFDYSHLHQIINIGQAILKKKEKTLLRNSVMELSYDSVKGNLIKKNFNCSFTESLNKKKSEIKFNLEFLCEKGLVKEENKDKFLLSLEKGFECNQVLNKDVIDFVAINNLTTSSRNGSEVIIEPGRIVSKPLIDGLFLFKPKTLIFLLEGQEDYRKFVSFAVLCLVFDRYNTKFILQTNSEEVLKSKSENHINSMMNLLHYDVKKYNYFGLNSGVKLLDFMIEKMSNN